MMHLTWVTAWAIGTIPVQGAIHLADGGPVDGSHAVHVALFEDPGDASSAWDAALTVDFHAGAFALGLDGVPDALLQAEGLTLTLAVDGGAPSAPVPVAWAARARFAAVAGDLDCVGCVPSTALAASGVSGGEYAHPTAITVDAAGRVTALTAGAAPLLSAEVAAGGGLTGDGTVSAPLALSTSGVTAGTYGLATLTVDAAGRLTSAAAGSLSLTGAGLTGAGTPASPLALATSGVTAGTYAGATVTVDALGRVTAASSPAFGSAAQPARSCLSVFRRNPSAASGPYTLDLVGVDVSAYAGLITGTCDMSDGGGWTRCATVEITKSGASAVHGRRMLDGGVAATAGTMTPTHLLQACNRPWQRVRYRLRTTSDGVVRQSVVFDAGPNAFSSTTHDSFTVVSNHGPTTMSHVCFNGTSAGVGGCMGHSGFGTKSLYWGRTSPNTGGWFDGANTGGDYEYVMFPTVDAGTLVGSQPDGTFQGAASTATAEVWVRD